MAKAKPSTMELKKLTPNAVDTVIDGQNIRVATNKSENAIMNMIVAAQMRNLMQETIKKYKDDDVKLMPKELADLAKAARDIAQFSAEIYIGVEDIAPQEPKRVDPSAPDNEAPDFSVMTKPNEKAGANPQGPDAATPNGTTKEADVVPFSGGGR